MPIKWASIFNFLQPKKTETQHTELSEYGIPSTGPHPGLFTAYHEVFLKEMATIEAISRKDIKEMYDFISSGEGGFLTQSRYHQIIFDKYFKDIEWTWPEYEKWDEIFSGLNDYPRNWVRLANKTSSIEDMEIEDILAMLKVLELKELLGIMGIQYSSKANKNDLIDLVLSNPIINDELILNFPASQEAYSKRFQQGKFGLYKVLMRTIYQRAICLHEFDRQRKLGITKRNIIVVIEEDKRFVDLALAENPNALTPLFPYDTSVWQCEIPGVLD